MTTDYWYFLVILFLGMFLSIKKDKLTIVGAITGGLMGIFIFMGAGFNGIAMLGVFFLTGTLATVWKINTKEKLGVAEKNKGKRTASQVIANSGVAGITGLLSWFYPGSSELFQLMMAASLSSAIADTISSELGTLYGTKFYDILNFQPGIRGKNGVVSVEGTLLGIIGSILIAVIYAARYEWNYQFGIIVLAGTVGNFADSVLGATLERNQYINNDAVNFINTMIAAIFGLLLMIIV